MPSNDLVLNVRQVAGYDPTGIAIPTDSLLLQRGLGGAYLSISPAALVSTALSTGGDMAIGGQLSVQSIQGGVLQMSNGSFGQLFAGQAEVTSLDVQGVPVATQEYVAWAANVLQSLYDNATVWSFNQRVGQVILNLNDVMGAGGAPIHSPVFTGCPSAPTPAPLSRNTRLATTAWAWSNIEWSIQNLLATQPFVFSFNGRTGDVTLQSSDIQGAEAALLNSPPLTGTPTAPTAPPLTNNDQLATTAYVDAAVAAAGAIYAPINSPAFTGYATAPTPAPGTSNAQIATTAFVMAAVAASVSGVATFNGRSGNVTLQVGDISAAGGALLTSPVFNGTPQGPTAPLGTNTSQLATTAFVIQELGGANVGVMSFNGRGGAVVMTGADISAAGGALLASPALTGVPTAPTASTGTSTQQIATTAFVMSAVGAGAVTAFNGRTGNVTLTANDISAANGIINPSPGLTGVPTAPTAAAGTSSTQIATTAFVTAALAAAGGVASFNGRAGAVTLTSADLNGAGGPFVPFSGGTMTGPLALVGFVNGSAAAAGQVGEVLTSGGATISNVAQGSYLQVATLTLTAGVWDVSCGASLTQTVVGTGNIDWRTGLGTAAELGPLTWSDANFAAWPPAGAMSFVIPASFAGAANRVNLGPSRYSVSSSTTIVVQMVAWGTTGATFGYWAFITARRVR